VSQERYFFEFGVFEEFSSQIHLKEKAAGNVHEEEGSK